MKNLDLDDFKKYETEEDFLKDYPPKQYGKYRPQPWNEPYEFPCLVRDEGIMPNDNGADHVILSVIYFNEK